MAIILRIIAVTLAYGLACIAASLVLTLGTLTPHWDEVSALGLPTGVMAVVVAAGAAVIGAIALLPALLVIVLTESFASRSIILYAVSGGVLALALAYGLDFAGYVGAPDSFVARERQVLAAAGIAGGLVYWLVAGRSAGARKRAHE